MTNPSIRRDAVHEEALVRAFIVPRKRERYLDRLASAKGRGAFISQNFRHMNDLDPRFAERIDSHMPLVEFKQRADADNARIYDLLRAAGAPHQCYGMSPDPDLDGTEADLRTTLDEVIGLIDG